MGNRVISYLDRIFSGIEPEFYPLVLFMVEMAGTEEAEDFLMRHLDPVSRGALCHDPFRMHEDFERQGG